MEAMILTQEIIPELGTEDPRLKPLACAPSLRFFQSRAEVRIDSGAWTDLSMRYGTFT